MFAFEVSLKLSDKGTTFYLLRVIMGKILLLVENVHVFFLQGEMLFLVKNYAECGALSDNAVFYKYLTFMIVFHNASGE